MHGKLGSPEDNTSKYLMKYFQMSPSIQKTSIPVFKFKDPLSNLCQDVVVGESIGDALAYELMASGD
jgi:hypothetical protein